MSQIKYYKVRSLHCLLFISHNLTPRVGGEANKKAYVTSLDFTSASTRQDFQNLLDTSDVKVKCHVDAGTEYDIKVIRIICNN